MAIPSSVPVTSLVQQLVACLEYLLGFGRPIQAEEWRHLMEEVQVITRKAFRHENWVSPRRVSENLLHDLMQYADPPPSNALGGIKPSVAITKDLIKAVLADLFEVKSREGLLLEDKNRLGVLRMSAALLALRVVNGATKEMREHHVLQWWPVRFQNETERKRTLGYIECALGAIPKANRERLFQNPVRFCPFIEADEHCASESSFSNCV